MKNKLQITNKTWAENGVKTTLTENFVDKGFIDNTTAKADDPNAILNDFNKVILSTENEIRNLVKGQDFIGTDDKEVVNRLNGLMFPRSKTEVLPNLEIGDCVKGTDGFTYKLVKGAIWNNKVYADNTYQQEVGGVQATFESIYNYINGKSPSTDETFGINDFALKMFNSQVQFDLACSSGSRVFCGGFSVPQSIVDPEFTINQLKNLFNTKVGNKDMFFPLLKGYKSLLEFEKCYYEVEGQAIVLKNFTSFLQTDPAVNNVEVELDIKGDTVSAVAFYKKANHDFGSRVIAGTAGKQRLGFVLYIKPADDINRSSADFDTGGKFNNL